MKNYEKNSNEAKALACFFEQEKLEWEGKAEKNRYREYQIFRFIADESSRERLMDDIKFAADWFEHPTESGRPQRGESDFQAIRLVPLLYECYEALDEKTANSIDRFFLVRYFFSFYDSENHSLMNRVSRYLAAQFYSGKDVFFEQFNPSIPQQLCEKDEEYINDFLDFRVKYGWGEFDSCGYTREVLLILNILYAYTKSKKLKTKTGMVMDIILLDMICDSKNGLYGGAHGRIYPEAALDSMRSGMFVVYCYYFGCRYSLDRLTVPTSFLLSGYEPSKIVFDIEKNRKFPYVNKERKHLHSSHSWSSDAICTTTLNAFSKLSINKMTYVDNRYILGAINKQDKYPKEHSDARYAHHQQHEWELTFLGGTNHKIFSHHPGDSGPNKQHNYWTGDFKCCCSTHYVNKNTAISLYNIEKPEKFEFINAYIPLDIFTDVVKEKNYVFLKYPGLYVSVYFSQGYNIREDGEFANREFLSEGRKHAVVVRVEYEEKFADMSEFIEYIHSLPVVFDKEKMELTFDSVFVSYEENREGEKTNKYPYEYLYDSPYMKSVWGSGIIELNGAENRLVYNFNEDGIK